MNALQHLGLLLAAVMLLTSHALAEEVSLVRVFKGERRLELLAGERIVRSFPVALGSNPMGHKVAEGDERTPEGRYFLDWRNSNSGYFRSIHISYPSTADVSASARLGVSPGGLIMIHGQPNGWGWLSPILQRFDWTDGCIAVDNGAMADIWALVPDGTAIVIKP